MDENRLKSLKNIKIPEPSELARQRAKDLALAAFEEEQSGKEKKTSLPPQGTGEMERPISIINWIKGLDLMKNRFPIAATVSGLLLLPLGIFLYQNTALTPVVQLAPSPIIVGQANKAGANNTDANAAAQAGEAEMAANSDVQLEDKVAAPERAAKNQAATQISLGAPDQEIARGQAQAPNQAPNQAPLAGVVAPGPKPAGGLAFEKTRPVVSDGAPGDRFARFAESATKSVTSDPVSTFSIDVDTASYAYVRRALNEGRLPDPQAVRIEELVNYFSYDYPAPGNVDVPFAPDIEIVPTPWNEASELMRIGIKGYVPATSERVPVNLVFLIDTSGSMRSADKLPLLKRALIMLVDQLNENDQVSIVAYAGSAGTVLAPTAASNKAAIISALENLNAGGSTAGAAGIEQAYRLAEQARIEGGVNRVLLATDGDFNVGISRPDQLKRFIEGKRNSGIFLSVLGFGTGNLNDGLMQALAQNGNGNAYYIDNLREAQKVLVSEVGSTLVTIARDVKIQVEFNPAMVAEYRLIGYETRALKRQDFNNDKVDAGDVGAGHSVTALYEITPAGAAGALLDPLRYGKSVVLEGGKVNSDEIGYFKLRYKLPEEDVSRLIQTPITREMVAKNIAQASNDTRFAVAVAAFGQKLRGSVYGGGMDWAQIRQLAAGARGDDPQGYRAEFLSLIDIAASLSQ